MRVVEGGCCIFPAAFDPPCQPDGRPADKSRDSRLVQGAAFGQVALSSIPYAATSSESVASSFGIATISFSFDATRISPSGTSAPSAHAVSTTGAAAPLAHALQAAGKVGRRALRRPVLARRRKPVQVRPSGPQGGIRGGMRGLRKVHLPRRGIRRHRDREDGKGNRQDQGGGWKDEEGPGRKRPDRPERIARLKIRENSDKGGVSVFLVRQPCTGSTARSAD